MVIEAFVGFFTLSEDMIVAACLRSKKGMEKVI
jgi:hypothetical protein